MRFNREIEINRGVVKVDRQVCDRLAALLRRVTVPIGVDHPIFDDEVDFGSFFLLLVAICHQTQSVAGSVNGRTLRGWDYLQEKLLQQVKKDAGLLQRDRWRAMSGEGLTELFRDAVTGSSVPQAGERAQIVRNLGEVMCHLRWHRLQDLYIASKGRIATGKTNLLQLLRMFSAYRDPVFKKSFLLLGLMRDLGAWDYADDENLGPPIDYHEIRGHLRIGTIKVHDASLDEKLRKREHVLEEEDIAIRTAIVDAIAYIAQQISGVDAMRLHYLFWNLFRNICTRAMPYCRSGSGKSPELPARYLHLIVRDDFSSGCPFATACNTAQGDYPYIEHLFLTDWY